MGLFPTPFDDKFVKNIENMTISGVPILGPVLDGFDFWIFRVFSVWIDLPYFGPCCPCDVPRLPGPALRAIRGTSPSITIRGTSPSIQSSSSIINQSIINQSSIINQYRALNRAWDCFGCVRIATLTILQVSKRKMTYYLTRNAISAKFSSSGGAAWALIGPL